MCKIYIWKRYMLYTCMYITYVHTYVHSIEAFTSFFLYFAVLDIQVHSKTDMTAFL